MSRPTDPPVAVRRYDGRWAAGRDRVAAEEPLQVLLDGEPLSVVMRTPGEDVELVLGLLHAERVVASLEDVERVLVSAEAPAAERLVDVRADLLESNAVDVRLRRARRRPKRSFLASSACGVCGATAVEDLALDLPPLAPGPRLEPAWIVGLPDRLRRGQAVFDRTGGLHAAGAFVAGGEALAVREDVGRHNAVDKVAGRLLLDGATARGLVRAVSGRAGYEVVQKAVRAGFCAIAAVGAPSSLAVALAQRCELTLIGFLRGGRFNVYSGIARLAGEQADTPPAASPRRASRRARAATPGGRSV